MKWLVLWTLSACACARAADSKPERPAPAATERSGTSADDACSVLAQNCAPGKYCAADIDKHGICPTTGACQLEPESPAIELSLPVPPVRRSTGERSRSARKGGSHKHKRCSSRCAMAGIFRSRSVAGRLCNRPRSISVSGAWSQHGSG